MDSLDDIPYVVATGEIAQAYNQKHPHGVSSINQLIEERARTHPDTVVAGISVPPESSTAKWTCTTLSPSIARSHARSTLAYLFPLWNSDSFQATFGVQ